MKTITLIQPWATLIALGEKKIETRSWETSYRGPLLIHAGKKVEHDLCRQHPFTDVLLEHDIAFKDQIPTGVIIAKCNLVDCIKITHQDGVIAQLSNNLIVDENEYWFGDYTPGRYAWILDNIELLKEPIPAKGKLSLWEFNCDKALNLI